MSPLVVCSCRARLVSVTERRNAVWLARGTRHEAQMRLSAGGGKRTRTRRALSTHCDGHGDGAAGRVPELIEASGLHFDPTAVLVLVLRWAAGALPMPIQ